MVFNPSSLERLTHVVLGAYALGGAFVASVSAYYILRGTHAALAKKSLALSVLFGAAACVALPISGDSQARTVARTQPAKLAAFEGLYKTTANAPLSLLGLPDDSLQATRFSVAVPGLLSFLVHGRRDAVVTGLDAFKAEDRPPVAAAFLLYHGMVGAGFLLAALFAAAAWRLRGGKLFTDRLLLVALVGGVLAAFAANELGWVAAEVGRQPWIVYGLLRTRDAVSRSVPPGQVAASILMFGAIYALLFSVWVTVLNDKIAHGPDEEETPARKSGGWLDAASQLADPAGGSLTEAKESAR
jgi:cytochrome d ubiquinol oxidase subunit I